ENVMLNRSIGLDKISIMPIRLDSSNLLGRSRVGGTDIVEIDGKCYQKTIGRINPISTIPGQTEASEVTFGWEEVPCPPKEEETPGGVGGALPILFDFFVMPTINLLPEQEIFINGYSTSGPRKVTTRPQIILRPPNDCKKVKDRMSEGSPTVQS